MITTKQLQEEWLMLSDYGMVTGDVFVNPTSSDIKELYKINKEHEVRFIVDNKQKKVFVWDVWMLHGWVTRDLGIFERYNSLYPNKMISGTAKIIGGKLVVKDSDTITTILRTVSKQKKLYKNDDDWNYLRDLAAQDWTWAKKYIDISSYINKINEVLE